MLEKEILKLPEFKKRFEEKNKNELTNHFFKKEEEMYEFIANLPTIKKYLLFKIY